MDRPSYGSSGRSRDRRSCALLARLLVSGPLHWPWSIAPRVAPVESDESAPVGSPHDRVLSPLGSPDRRCRFRGNWGDRSHVFSVGKLRMVRICSLVECGTHSNLGILDLGPRLHPCRCRRDLRVDWIPAWAPESQRPQLIEISRRGRPRNPQSMTLAKRKLTSQRAYWSERNSSSDSDRPSQVLHQQEQVQRVGW